jgi:hypothetical protein
MSPHDLYDVLDFSNGFVTSRTCCGDQPKGTYSLSENGQWIWTNSIHHKDKDIVVDAYLMQPHAFSITFINTKDPSETYTLPRRFFIKFPL